MTPAFTPHAPCVDTRASPCARTPAAEHWCPNLTPHRAPRRHGKCCGAHGAVGSNSAVLDRPNRIKPTCLPVFRTRRATRSLRASPSATACPIMGLCAAKPHAPALEVPQAGGVAKTAELGDRKSPRRSDARPRPGDAAPDGGKDKSKSGKKKRVKSRHARGFEDLKPAPALLEAYVLGPQVRHHRGRPSRPARMNSHLSYRGLGRERQWPLLGGSLGCWGEARCTSAGRCDDCSAEPPDDCAPAFAPPAPDLDRVPHEHPPQIGKGHYGRVYSATSKACGLQVAVKLLDRQRSKPHRLELEVSRFRPDPRSPARFPPEPRAECGLACRRLRRRHPALPRAYLARLVKSDEPQFV